tara:strand:+ start:329 stop:499 length:171 start_codon:yes stop_codon:yes gene_type:complete
MQKENQTDRSDLIVIDAQSKAAEKLEKERKKRKKDFIADWFRFVELTNKYLKQKLN